MADCAARCTEGLCTCCRSPPGPYQIMSSCHVRCKIRHFQYKFPHFNAKFLIFKIQTSSSSTGTTSEPVLLLLDCSFSSSRSSAMRLHNASVAAPSVCGCGCIIRPKMMSFVLEMMKFVFEQRFVFKMQELTCTIRPSCERGPGCGAKWAPESIIFST